MKVAALVISALFLGACSQSDSDRAREQARQATEELKHDSRQALHEAQTDAAKASKELNRDLDKTRDKVREALNTHSDGSTRPRDRDNH